MQGVCTLQDLLKALSSGTRQNSLHLCLTPSPPFSFCLFILLSLDLFLLFFSVVLFPFLSSTSFLSHESLPALLPSVSHAHFFFSSPSISFLSSTLPPSKKGSPYSVCFPDTFCLREHLLQGPVKASNKTRAAGAPKSLTAAGTCSPVASRECQRK